MMKDMGDSHANSSECVTHDSSFVMLLQEAEGQEAVRTGIGNVPESAPGDAFFLHP